MINQTAPDTTDDLEEVLSQEKLKEIKRKSVSGVFSFLIRTLFLQGIGLTSAFVLSDFFEPSDFGIYGFVVMIIGILVFFSDVGLAASLIQKKKNPTLTDYRTVFTMQQILAWIIVAITLVIVSTGLVEDRAGQAGVWILLSLAISFPLATFKTIPSIMLERKLEFSKIVIPQIFEQIVFHGLLIFLAWQKFGVMAYAYAIIARSITGVVVMMSIQSWKIGLEFSKRSFKTLVSYGVKFQLNDLLARIKDQLFFIVLGWHFPPTGNNYGYIQWAKNWSLYPYNLTVQNVMAITFPTFSRLQGHKAALRKAIEKSLFFISLAIFPVLVGMSVFVIPLVHVFEKYHKWQPAVMSLIFFSLSIAWGAISTPLTNTLNAVGKINTTLKLMVMWTSLTWIVTPLAIWKFGFNGVGIASFIISFSSIFSVIALKRYVPINALEQVWRQLVAAIAMGVVGVIGLPLWKTSFAMMILGMIISALTYGGVMLAVGYKKILLEVRDLRS